MSITQNFPAIRPTLNLDFVNSLTVDPRITFTRASTATYFDRLGVLRTAAINEPRIDFDPETLACRGLLIEEQRTNLLLQGAGDFNLGYWYIGPNSIRVGNALAPDGTNTATTYSTTHPSYAYISQHVALNANTTYTLSCFARLRSGPVPTTGGILRLDCDTDGDAGTANRIELPFTGIDAKWRRFQLTVKNVLAVPSTVYVAYDFNPGIEIDIWGVQLEVGAFPTSYIPTTSSQVTRSADSAVMTGTNFSSWYRQDEGTFLTTFSRIYTGDAVGSDVLVSADDGSGANRIQLRLSGNTVDAVTSAGGSVQVDAPGIGVPGTEIRSSAFAYKTNDFAFAYAGTYLQTDTSGVVPLTNRLGIGASGDNNEHANSHIRRIAYWPARLPDAQLQALTA